MLWNNYIPCLVKVNYFQNAAQCCLWVWPSGVRRVTQFWKKMYNNNLIQRRIQITHNEWNGFTYGESLQRKTWLQKANNVYKKSDIVSPKRRTCPQFNEKYAKMHLITWICWVNSLFLTKNVFLLSEKMQANNLYESEGSRETNGRRRCKKRARVECSKVRHKSAGKLKILSV